MNNLFHQFSLYFFLLISILSMSSLSLQTEYSNLIKKESSISKYSGSLSFEIIENTKIIGEHKSNTNLYNRNYKIYLYRNGKLGRKLNKIFMNKAIHLCGSIDNILEVKDCIVKIYNSGIKDFFIIIKSYKDYYLFQKELNSLTKTQYEKFVDKYRGMILINDKIVNFNGITDTKKAYFTINEWNSELDDYLIKHLRKIGFIDTNGAKIDDRNSNEDVISIKVIYDLQHDFSGSIIVYFQLFITCYFFIFLFAYYFYSELSVRNYQYLHGLRKHNYLNCSLLLFSSFLVLVFSYFTYNSKSIYPVNTWKTVVYYSYCYLSKAFLFAYTLGSTFILKVSNNLIVLVI